MLRKHCLIYCYLIYFSGQSYEVIALIGFILQVRKLRLPEYLHLPKYPGREGQHQEAGLCIMTPVISITSSHHTTDKLTWNQV